MDDVAFTRDSPRPEPVGAQKTGLQSPGPAERNVLDDDLALARVLQEQERAFFLLQSGQGWGVEGLDEDDEQADEGELDDEEIARRMQAQEQHEAYRQMLAAQGIDVVNLDHEVEDADTDGMTYDDLSMLGEVAGSVSKGLSQAAINQLPILNFSDLQKTLEPGQVMDKCCICQLEFEACDEITPLPCCHHYHKECIGQWLSINKVCPVCSKELPGQSV